MAIIKTKFDRGVEGATNIVDSGTEGTKVASGTTAQRGSTAGQWRYNTTTGFFEGRNASTFSTLEPTPTVSSVDDGEVDSAGGGNQTIVITGSNFTSGAVASFVGTSASFNAATTTVDSSTQITAVAPKSSFLNAQEPYKVKVTSATGLAGTSASGLINVDNAPTWTTNAGSLGSIYEDDTGNHFTVAASDAEGDTISYSLQSGSLAGLSLNSSTGVISGDPTDVSSDTTNSFTLRATAGGKTADRAFSYITKNDTLANGLIAHYLTGGGTDSSGNGYNGTLSGSNTGNSSTPTDSGTPFGSRTVTLYPDGNAYTALPTATIITGTNDRTITCWVKPSASLDDNDYIFGFGRCASSNKGTFNARCGGNKMGFMGCGADYDNQGAVIYSSGTWVRIFYTMSGTTVSTYYLDGSGNRVSNWSTSLTGLTTDASSGATASIGAHASAPSGDIAGCNASIADFRIYNRILTEAEMERLYNK